MSAGAVCNTSRVGVGSSTSVVDTGDAKEADGVTVGVCVAVCVSVIVAVGDGVSDGACVGVWASVDVSVSTGATVSVSIGVSVSIIVAVGDGVSVATSIMPQHPQSRSADTIKTSEFVCSILRFILPSFCNHQ